MTSCTAFDGPCLIARGALPDITPAVRAALARGGAVLVFDDVTGAVVDIDLREAPPPEDARPRGRPKLGVVAREVTLLPRHWDWLALQRGGASQALRRLIDEARRADGGESDRRSARERGYRFMAAMAGDLPGFEEASRALFADARDRFATHAAAWPADVRDHVVRLVWG